ncbi:MAG TPA: glycine cleavage system protein GcvH [Planctomycetota bacterium]|jgi:glycine cleavage system H protein|nr:glycine cleavage system protein GcvH [Planctomycetota bacterium]
MARPTNLKYTSTHEWVRVEGDVAVVGITDYAVEQLSDLAFIDLPEKGTMVEKDKRFGEIESTKSVSDLIAPVSGEIIAVNSGLADDLQRISSSPFDDGWMVRIRMSKPPEVSSLLSADAYASHILTQDH